MELVLAFESFPARSLTLMLFREVQNSNELRDKIVSGALEPEAAFLNASLVTNAFVVHAAAQRALDAEARGAMTTRTLHTELVFTVAATKHIGQALSHFGIAAGTKDVLIARFDADPGQAAALAAQVQGRQVPLSDLAAAVMDEAAVRKQYKVSPEELQLGSLSDAVVTRIAARDC